MDWSLIIFVVVVAFFSFRGYRNGLLKSLSRILSLLAGYVAAILYAPQFTGIVESQLQVQGIAAFITASLVVFVAASALVSMLFWLFEKLRSANTPVSTMSSLGGASMGSVVGVIVAIVIVWTFGFVRDMSAPEDTGAQAQAQESTIENLANRAASTAVESAMSLGSTPPEITSLSVAMVESPAKISQHAQRLANSDDLTALLSDPGNQVVLNSGDANAVKELPAFKELVRNPDLLELAKSAGMMGDTGDNAHTMEESLASQFTDIWRKTQQVKNDRRVQEILSDPEFRQKLDSGNPMDLLTNPHLLELTGIIFSEKAASGDTGNDHAGRIPSERELQGNTAKETSIYRWTDKSGRVHFSDSDPEKQ